MSHLPAVDVDVVVATHDLSRPVHRVVTSALRGADLRGVLPSGHRVRVTVVCHGVDAGEVRRAVEAELEELAQCEPGLEELTSHVRYLEIHDGLRSPAGPFNVGFGSADGRYIAIIGSDDWFAEGALGAWASLADELGSAWLMPRLDTGTGEHIATPRTRPGRTRDLDLVLDRLAYRTAPLGLLRRTALHDLGLMPEPLTSGLATGEDVELTLRLAASGERIDYAPQLPPYVIGTDGGTRTTSLRRPVAEELAAHARLLDQRWVLALPSAARRAIVVKTLRIHVLGAIRRRTSALDWGPGEGRWVQTLTRDLLTMAPEAENALHKSDRELLTAVLTATDTDSLAAAAARRAQASRWEILLTPDLRANLDRESTVRAHLDHSVDSTWTRGREWGARRRRARHTPSRLHSPARPRVLILSFSPIASDARVLKQVRHLEVDFDVVTCGYGPAPEGVAAHLQIPEGVQNHLDGRLITLRNYRAAYLAQVGVRWVLRHLRPGQADVILANDLDAVPIALWLRPRAGVHADLHEYFPRLHEEHDAWMRRISPYQAWLCRRFLPRCAAITTVSARLAAEYAEQFGVEVGVVTNATPYAELSPRPVGSPLRLVHSGACLRNRALHVMVDAVVAAAADGTDVTLDLYLTPNDPPYLTELKDRAEFTAGIVRVHDPVPYEALLATLHHYDLGIHVLPPVSFNNANALPNKIFDYVQARIGLLVGPSPEMARMVREHGLGLVAAGFDMQSVATAVSQLDVEQVTAFKGASDAAAHELCDAEQSRRWVESVRAIAAQVHG
ncbi:MAG: glycosyltransferase [Ornithinimicrobium sp.]|uniref:glycosyltransferase n=1 Tax=Ornithinimicrobium sp. TaxID=1977084 RepID=UPI0026DEEED5|nr:glycosyltransferase [Ornithinimicrobium sp.]MDO5740074.1 glycosyltransferase [Ornithinimicrobium sp.]